VTLRTELLFEKGSERRYSQLGLLILQPPRPRTFADSPDRDRLEALQRQLYDLLAAYEIADHPRQFRGLGDGLQSLEHALRRCAWLLPRMDRTLSARAWHPDDERAKHCPGCPWLVGGFDECGGCPYPDCPTGEAQRGP
jgi:hypothetical protein